MKRTLLFALLAATAQLAFAQTPSGPPPGGPRGFGGPPIEHLTRDLGLTTDQATQVRQIFDAQRAKMEAERAEWDASGTRPSREEMHTRMEQRDTEVRAQLAAVLTPEQLAKFDDLRKRQRRMGPPPGAGEPGAGAAPAQ